MTMIQWPASTEADIVGYWIYRDGNTVPLNSVRIPQAGAPQFRDSGLTNGRSYSYRVAAEDLANQIGPKSNPVTATPQAGPGWTLNP
jgi:chitinase